MPQINLLHSLPKIKRSRKLLKERKEVKEIGEHNYTSRLFGYHYFDGNRRYGYGGMYDDGRWKSVAKDIITFYNLEEGSMILDVGSGKGFLVKELLYQGMEAYGLDISKYALKHCPWDIVGKLHYGDVLDIHFPNDSFDLVLSINTIHNIPKNLVPLAIKEILRVSKKDAYIVVDSYYNEQQKKDFEDWELTCKTHMYPEEWVDFFVECGYDKDYNFTIHEFENE